MFSNSDFLWVSFESLETEGRLAIGARVYCVPRRKKLQIVMSSGANIPGNCGGWGSGKYLVK